VEANSTGGQGSRRAVAPSDDDDEEQDVLDLCHTIVNSYILNFVLKHIGA
jgi:hypothetical protein